MKAIILLLIFIVFITPGFAQRELSASEVVFDYFQMKRKVARDRLDKEKPSEEEFKASIELLKELLVYLEKPEILAMAEINQSIKSQRADVRYDLAKIFMKAGRKAESLKMLSEMADEAGSGAYLYWFENEPDKTLFAELQTEPEFQKVVAQLKMLNNFWNSPTFKTPFRTNISEDEKIAGLSLFWSTVKYNFAYFNQVPELDWDKVYLEYLPKVRQTKTTFEYYRVLQEMCALLRDGHTNVYLPKELYQEFSAKPPLKTILVEDKIIIWKVNSEILSKQGLKEGLEIIAIDGIPVREYAEKFVQPFQSSSTKQWRDFLTYTSELLGGDKNKPIELSLWDEKGNVVKKSISRTGYPESVEQTKPFEFKVLEGNIGYMALNSFSDDSVVKGLGQNLKSVAQTDALIIDLRENGGGDSSYGYSILAYLTDKPFQTSHSSTREYKALRRVYRVVMEFEGYGDEIIKPHKNLKPYDKPVIVLTSPRTFSAAEDFVVAFDFMKRGKIIGEATGGSTGQPLFFNLPGGGSARVCIKRDSYPDRKKFVGTGVQPNILVSPKVSDFVTGKDRVLETALLELKR